MTPTHPHSQHGKMDLAPALRKVPIHGHIGQLSDFQLVAEICSQAQLSRKEIAAELEISHWLLSKFCQALSGVGRHITLHRVAALQEITGSDLAAHWLAARTGGVFVSLPTSAGEAPTNASLNLAASSIKEFGELISAYSGALTDGLITRSEATRIVSEAEDALVAIHRIVFAVKEAVSA